MRFSAYASARAYAATVSSHDTGPTPRYFDGDEYFRM
jgi:hypothetical protein